MIVWIAIGIGIVLSAWIIIIYNRLIRLRNETKNAWHQIDVQLKRRHDLIPNLVSTVRGYMDFEKSTLLCVTEARTHAISAATVSSKAAAEDVLSHALNNLFFVMENYPALKSNENVLQLQEELTTTENRIAFARQLYNDLVANYRTRLEVFPDVLIAHIFGFQPLEYFLAEKAEIILPGMDLSARG